MINQFSLEIDTDISSSWFFQFKFKFPHFIGNFSFLNNIIISSIIHLTSIPSFPTSLLISDLQVE